jgi:hypothetical protein
MEYLEALFANVVGQAEETCPDVVNVSWLCLVVPSETETYHARWETAPTWQVIQAARLHGRHRDRMAADPTDRAQAMCRAAR